MHIPLMIGRIFSSRYGALFILSFVLAWAGCVSTQDRYEKAQKLTGEGRYAEAARYYVRVLQEEPDWPNAREELEAVGQQAVDEGLEEAEAAADAGRYEAAVAVLDDLDGLRAETESVGVTLAVPDDYEAFRRETVEGAADMLIAEGRSAEEAGNWPAADEAYERARRYVLSERRLVRLDEAQARVALRWSEDEMERHHFQGAYLQADRIFELVGAEHMLAEGAEALQTEALKYGTRTVAFLPLWRTEQAASVAPRPFLDDLNDVLQYDFWSAPPLFIAPADPIATRRALRRMNADRTVLASTEAADAGRVLNTDFVVAGELTAFVREEDIVEEEVRETQMRVRRTRRGEPAWRDTTYVVETFDLELEAAVEYRLIHPRTRRVIDHGATVVEYEGRLQRGVFRGDYRDLDLSGSELSLFDSEEQRAAEREIENQLIDRLAAHLADDVFGRVLRHID